MSIAYQADDVVDGVAAAQGAPPSTVEPQGDTNVRKALLVRVVLGILCQLLRQKSSVNSIHKRCLIIRCGYIFSTGMLYLIMDGQNGQVWE